MLPLLITIAGIHFVALATPGPDFFFVSRVALSQGRTAGFKAMLGVSLGVLLWATLALLGLNILLQKAAWLQQGIMVAGGLYLCYLAYQIFKSVLYAQNVADAENPDTQIKQKDNHVFLKGLLTNLSNPKAIIFFASVFSVFIGNLSNENAKWWILLLIVLETMLWFSVVATVFSLPKMQNAYKKAGKWIDGCAGALFAGFGLYLIYSGIV